MNTCIYTRTKFERASGEHILQNFLGARWTDATIVCDEVQQEFGDTIDTALADSLNGFRTMLGTLGGRGGTAPPIKHGKDQQGNSYHLTSGGQPQLAEPIVQAQLRDDGSADVHIRIGNKSQMGWALHILKKKYPKLNIDPSIFAESAKTGRDYLESPLHLRFGIGGPDFFRGTLKAVFNLLGANRRDVALRSEFDELRDFIVTGSGDSATFVGWPTMHAPFGIPRLGTHDHFVAVWCCGQNVDAFLQFFGEIPFVLRLGTVTNAEGFCFTYLVNPHRDTEPAEVRNRDFEPSILPTFDSCPHEPGPAVWEAHRIRLDRFLAEYQKRAESKVINDIVEDVLGSKDGEIITREDIAAINERMMKFVKFKLGVKDDR